jgi:uncharacterized protein (DUF4415 family)
MRQTDEPTTKVTLSLYDADIETMKRRYGYGWSARIREVLHQWLKQKTSNKTHAFLGE